MWGATDQDPPIFDSSKLDQQAAPLSQKAPKYPAKIRFQGIEGEVMVDFLVYPDGTVKSARALPSPHPEFAARCGP